MQLKKNKIILSDDQAASHYGDNWIEYINSVNASSLFFDGFEVFASVVKNGPFTRLELDSVYDDINFNEIYN